MRKSRRKIKRRKRDKQKRKQRKTLWQRHLHCAPTNIWTKLTTYFMMVFEAVFVIWWLQETVLNWEDLVYQFSALFNSIGVKFKMLIDLVMSLGGG